MLEVSLIINKKFKSYLTCLIHVALSRFIIGSSYAALVVHVGKVKIQTHNYFQNVLIPARFTLLSFYFSRVSAV